MNKRIGKWLWGVKNKGVLSAYSEIKMFEARHDEFVSQYFESLLRHAKATVPFYKNIQVVGVDKISSLPIMTKDIIRSSRQELLSSKLSSFRYWQNTSGGSTGEPVRLIQDEEYQRWVGASLYYYYKDLVGCDWASAKKLDIWGSVEDYEKKSRPLGRRLQNLLSNTVFINAFSFGETEMYKAIKKLNDKRPEILKGYANSLYDLAYFIEKNSLQIHQPRIIITCTSMIYPEQRAVVKRVFGGMVLDFYGSRETSAIAGETTTDEGKVILEFNNIVEVVDGEVLITNLHNYSMPLIRYKIMDQATSVIHRPGKLPVLTGLKGRTFDYFLIDGNNRLHVQYVITLFFYIEELISFQIIQHDFTKYTIKYIPQPGKEVPEMKRQEVMAKMKSALRSDIDINWVAQSEIEKTPSGKHFYARCEVGA